MLLLLFQIELKSSALNAEGLAARVSAAGSNRVKLRNGVAVFKQVRIQAQAEGLYKLTVGSKSRKDAVQEAMVMVKVGWCGAHNSTASIAMLLTQPQPSRRPLASRVTGARHS